MRTVDLIRKKRDGLELSAEELAFLIQGYTAGDIPDYQMAAWAMAVYFRGMTPRETAQLTLEMAKSGEQIDLSPISGIKVDKHSSGGVGDTGSLVIVPLVAAAGAPVAKMSGRGLGHTGGTIDKLESIPGFQTERTREQFIEQVNRVGAAVIGQTGDITPADKKLYSLRDVTSTVDSIPLIASSIMSKKLAAGADAIVLDVKVGGGAFMKTLDDAIALAETMVSIGVETGRETVAVLTGMEEPLGSSIGNALEVREAIEVLQGKGSPRLLEVSLTLGSHMLVLAGVAADLTEARKMLQQIIADGSGLRKLKDMIAAQEGNPAVVDDLSLLPGAERIVPVRAAASGYVAAVEAEEIGVAAMLLGAGRATKESVIDLGVGVKLFKGIGDRVEQGDILAELYINGGGDELENQVADKVAGAFSISPEKVDHPALIYAVVSRKGTEMLVPRQDEERL
ncbi:pyrimidine-nucleoside phosphorylase [Gorillibacterium massiliense]|uniref:pyrimidine-nucleoside phosphorylase n=1 Tax=Gorillibacterium massiliense TaxID=1280390 RepID=UPI0004AD37A2|nr:pyrimidine-nucleoside phosphorylase [Gorillibacterium massiliense]